MPDPTVSVIVPVFNTEQYLDECLESVLGQRFRDIEVLCVDDGSTDGSVDILHRHAARDPRMRVIELGGNHGPGAARNRALERSVGEYVAFIDSDDLIHEDFVADLYEAARQDGADVAMCPIGKFSASGSAERYAPCTYDVLLPAELDDRAFTWQDIPDLFALRFASCNKLYRRGFLDERDIRYPEGIFYEDLVFTFRCLLSADRLRLVRRELYLNRRQRQDATTFEQGGRVYGAITSMELLERFLASDEQYASLEEPFAAFRFARMAGYLHKNDAEHLPRFYEEFQRVAADPRLDDNRYLLDRDVETRRSVLQLDLQGFLVRELWRARTGQAKVRRQREQLRAHNARLKQRIDRSRLLTLEERWRRLYRLRVRPAVRFALRLANSVRRRLPASGSTDASRAPVGSQ